MVSPPYEPFDPRREEIQVPLFDKYEKTLNIYICTGDVIADEVRRVTYLSDRIGSFFLFRPLEIEAKKKVVEI